MKLPVNPPVEPMLASLSRELPRGDGWLYEPKWDGFRSIVFRDGDEIFLQSRDLKPLGRYFPELEEKLLQILPERIVLDGEIVIAGPDGLDFDALLLRIHPAASRVKKLAAESPSSFIAFDLLAEGDENLMKEPLEVRRKKLEKSLKGIPEPVHLTPATTDSAKAAQWFKKFEGAGLDGVIAKRLEDHYVPKERVMIKVKHQRTADCVVAGFRWNKKQQGEAIGSILLGLYERGVLHYVGHASNFKKQERVDLVKFLEPYRTSIENSGFGKGRTPGGPSRWTQGEDKSFEALRPELVCEVAYDHMQGDRFRHGTSFMRWRFDKDPKTCTYSQLKEAAPYDLKKIFQL